jgi:hypothetical protein
MLCRRLWDDLGLSENVRLELNSIGDAEERLRHRADLIAYFEARRAAGRRSPAPPAQQSAAHPRHQESGDAGDGQRGAASCWTTWARRIAGPLRGRARRSSTTTTCSTPSTRAWCAAWTTTTAPCSNGSPTSSARRARLRRRPLRSADRNLRRQADPGRRLRHGHRTPDRADEGPASRPQPKPVRRLHGAPGREAQLQAFVLAERMRDAGLDVCCIAQRRRARAASRAR